MEDNTPTKHGQPEHGGAHSENPAVSYERTDLDIYAVTKFGIGLAIATMAAAFMMWGLFAWFMKHQPEGTEDIPNSVVEARKGLVPPQPRLQGMGNPEAPNVAQGDLRSPHVELERFREAEAMQLDSYAWVDPAKGTVRIPVEAAKDLVLKKGLPTKVTAEGGVTTMASNPEDGVGTPAAAQPQRVFYTGSAAIGSAQVIGSAQEKKEEKPESTQSK